MPVVILDFTSKAIADKCDVGCIVSVAAPEDLNRLQEVIAHLPAHRRRKPTHVIDIYKVRRGRFKSVRIWIWLDLGTGERYDLFMTNQSYEVIECMEVAPMDFTILSDERKAVPQLNERL